MKNILIISLLCLILSSCGGIPRDIICKIDDDKYGIRLKLERHGKVYGFRITPESKKEICKIILKDREQYISTYNEEIK